MFFRYINQCLDLLNAGSDRATQKDGEVYEKSISIAFGEDDCLPLKDAEKDFEAYVKRGRLRASENEDYREYLVMNMEFEKEFKSFLE